MHSSLRDTIAAVRADGRQRDTRCPGHDDRRASLSVGLGDGHVLLKCHTGCSTETVLEAAGLMWADVMPATRNGLHQSRPQVVATDAESGDGEAPDTAKELPTDYRASSRPYHPQSQLLCI
jgi:hypothetical protein